MILSNLNSIRIILLKYYSTTRIEMTEIEFDFPHSFKILADIIGSPPFLLILSPDKKRHFWRRYRT